MVAVLLFAQLAVAAHACPIVGLAGEHRETAMVVAMAPCNTAGASATDVSAADDGTVALPEVPSLCFEHCHDGAQAMDPHGAAAAFGPPPGGALLMVLDSAMAPLASAGLVAAERIAPGTSPPHAIAHCCLRV